MYTWKQAETASEEAFFHPTMLSMLYFPEDHKMAVYIPYFVPVLLPVSIIMYMRIHVHVCLTVYTHVVPLLLRVSAIM